eukprot:1313417-Rhodomonas_salina.1
MFYAYGLTRENSIGANAAAARGTVTRPGVNSLGRHGAGPRLSESVTPGPESEAPLPRARVGLNV